MNIHKFGWVVAAALVGVMVGVGFETPTQKVGHVDLIRAIEESEFYKTQSNTAASAEALRDSILQFINQNRAMLPVDAEKYVELSIKETPTAADKTEMDRIVQDAKTATAKQRELATKANPTEGEQKQLTEFGTRMSQNAQSLPEIQSRLVKDFQNIIAKLNRQAQDKARDIVKEIAAKQAYTVVYISTSVAYTPNDLTADVKKALDSKK